MPAWELQHAPFSSAPAQRRCSRLSLCSSPGCLVGVRTQGRLFQECPWASGLLLLAACSLAVCAARQLGRAAPSRQGSSVPLGKSRAGSLGCWKWAACDPSGGKWGYSKQPLPAKGGNNCKIQVNGLRCCPPGCVTSPDSWMSTHLRLNQTSFSCATAPVQPHFAAVLGWDESGSFKSLALISSLEGALGAARRGCSSPGEGWRVQRCLSCANFPFSLLVPGIFPLSFPLSPFLCDNMLNHSCIRAPQSRWGHKSKTSPSLQGEAS